MQHSKKGIDQVGQQLKSPLFPDPHPTCHIKRSDEVRSRKHNCDIAEVEACMHTSNWVLIQHFDVHLLESLTTQELSQQAATFCFVYVMKGNEWQNSHFCCSILLALSQECNLEVYIHTVIVNHLFQHLHGDSALASHDIRMVRRRDQHCTGTQGLQQLVSCVVTRLQAGGNMAKMSALPLYVTINNCQPSFQPSPRHVSA